MGFASTQCSKMRLRPGSAPNPVRGAYSGPSDPLAGFKGADSQREEKGEGRGGEGKRR